MLVRGLGVIAVFLALCSSGQAQNFVPDKFTPGPSVSLTAPGSVCLNTQGSATTIVTITGNGSGILGTFQATIDGINRFTIPATTPAGVSNTFFSANGSYIIHSGGFAQVCANLAGLGSGTAAFVIESAVGSGNL